MLLRVQAVDLEKELLVVDDGSTDGTRVLLQEFEKAQAAGQSEIPVQNGRAILPLQNIRFLFQDENRGKCAALRRGFETAGGDVLLVQDADLEYDPRVTRSYSSRFSTVEPTLFMARASSEGLSACITSGIMRETNS